jgi:uncharacterized protein (TIGR02145 family)
VDAPGTFAAKPEDAGKFYQWNRKVAYPAMGEVTNWDSSTPSGTTWQKANDPCPFGWRVPSHNELLSLLDVGSTWTTQNGVNGRIFGSGSNTLFLPAAGCRNYSDGTLIGGSGYGWYWSSGTPLWSGTTQGFNNNVVTFLTFASYGAEWDHHGGEYGHSVRCVQE